MKKLFQSPFFKNILNPAVRGLVKQIPIIGTPIAEIVSNASSMVANSQNPEAPQVELKHKWVSIAVQIGVGSLVFYGLYTKQISLEEIINMLGLNVPQ